MREPDIAFANANGETVPLPHKQHDEFSLSVKHSYCRAASAITFKSLLSTNCFQNILSKLLIIVSLLNKSIYFFKKIKIKFLPAQNL